MRGQPVGCNSNAQQFLDCCLRLGCSATSDARRTRSAVLSQAAILGRRLSTGQAAPHEQKCSRCVTLLKAALWGLPASAARLQCLQRATNSQTGSSGYCMLSQAGTQPTLQAQQCTPLLVSLQQAAIAAISACGLPECVTTATCCRPGPRTLPQQPQGMLVMCSRLLRGICRHVRDKWVCFT